MSTKTKHNAVYVINANISRLMRILSILCLQKKVVP